MKRVHPAADAATNPLPPPPDGRQEQPMNEEPRNDARPATPEPGSVERKQIEAADKQIEAAQKQIEAAERQIKAADKGGAEGKEGGDKEGGKEQDGDKDKQGKEGDDKNKQDQPGEGDKKKPSRKKFFLIGGIVLALVIVGGVLLWLHLRTRVTTDDAYVTGHVHQVSSRVAGTVTEVLVDDNEEVKVNEPLVKLDPRDYEVALQRAQADLAQAQAQALQAQAQVDQSTAQISQAQAQVSQSRAQVTQSGAQLEVANINYKRNSGLFQRDARAVAQADVDTTKAQLDTAQGAFDAARASLEAANANVEGVRSNAKADEARLVVANAAIKTGEANVRNAELQLSYCTVLAPIDGRVSRKTVEAGQRLSPGQALMAVVQDDVWILANFKETQLGKLTVGQKVEIEVDAFPKHSFWGHVDSFQAGTGATFSLLPPDNATGNFTKIVQRVPVKITFDEDSIRDFRDRVVPGLSVVPHVHINEK